MTAFDLKEVGTGLVVQARYLPLRRKWECKIAGIFEPHTVDRIIFSGNNRTYGDSFGLTITYKTKQKFYTFRDGAGYMYFTDYEGAKEFEPFL